MADNSSLNAWDYNGLTPYNCELDFDDPLNPANPYSIFNTYGMMRYEEELKRFQESGSSDCVIRCLNEALKKVSDNVSDTFAIFKIFQDAFPKIIKIMDDEELKKPGVSPYTSLLRLSSITALKA